MNNHNWKTGLSRWKIRKVENYIRRSEESFDFRSCLDLKSSEIGQMKRNASLQVLNIGLIFPIFGMICAMVAFFTWGAGIAGVCVYLGILNTFFGVYFYATCLFGLSPSRLFVNSKMQDIPERYRDYALFLKRRSRFLSVSGYKFASFITRYPDLIYRDVRKHGVGFTNRELGKYLAGNGYSRASQNNVTPSKNWNATFTAFDKVYKEWFSIESDIMEIVAHPLYSDMRSNATRNFHAKMAYAIQVEPEDATPYRYDHPFIVATVEMGIAWKALKAEALRISDSNFSASERKRLETARNMLAVAFNQTSSQNERQIAYRRAIKELEGLVNVPEQAILTIETITGIKEINA